jgi:uncharacterized Zn finger protein (UPF0148 family)
MQSKPNESPVKKGAALLLQGAALTDLACPACASPLFRLKDGTLWCIKDEKKVIIVKENQEQKTTQVITTPYSKLEATLMKKIDELQEKIEKTQDVDELQKLTLALSELLNSVEKIKKIKT